MADDPYKEMPCKMILVGDMQVGKTAFFNKVTVGSFNPNEMSTQTNLNSKKYFHINNKTICVDLWDTAGQEKFNSINQLFFKGADVIILLFDITNKTSFTNIKKDWMPLVRNNVPDDVVIGVAGNKFDLFEEQDVTEEELQQYASEIKAEGAFISCLQNLGLDDLITKLLEKFILVYKERHPIVIKEVAPKKKKCCKK